MSKVIIGLLVAIAVMCHPVVREISPGEKLNDIAGANAVIFTEF
jgi:hypothetical protein